MERKMIHHHLLFILYFLIARCLPLGATDIEIGSLPLCKKLALFSHIYTSWQCRNKFLIETFHMGILINCIVVILLAWWFLNSLGSGGCWAYCVLGCQMAGGWFYSWCIEHWQYEHFGPHHWLWSFWISGCIWSKLHSEYNRSSWEEILFCKSTWHWLVEYYAINQNLVICRVDKW